MTVDPTKKKITVRNVKVIYVDEKGYAAIIRTNIELAVPPIQYPTPSTLPDLMNMIVVAGKGIYCEQGTGSGAEDSEIQGSVYAGLVPETKLKGVAVNVKGCQHLLSAQSNLKHFKGRENCLCRRSIPCTKAAHLTAQRKQQCGRRSNLSSAKAELLGKSRYLSDDLTVKAGNGSYVKLAGEYYGYGDVESALNSENCIEYGYPKKNSGWNIYWGKCSHCEYL